MADEPQQNYANATHYLRCIHALGSMRKVYRMRCHVLKDMGDGRLKLRVWGDRNWKGFETKSRIRYVDAARVTLVDSTLAHTD